MFLFKVINGALLRVAVFGIAGLALGLYFDNEKLLNIVLLFGIFVYAYKDRYYAELAIKMMEKYKTMENFLDAQKDKTDKS